MQPPRASVIVRAKDKEDTIEATLVSLSQQTVRPEILLVDSGSTDRTLEIAERFAHRIVHIRAEDFSYGGALNLGAGAAQGSVHFALSAHCVAPVDWVERSLAHYDDPRVAGTGGMLAFTDGTPMRQPFHQDVRHARSNPMWGFSNHASSWRREVWEEFPFDDQLAASEDREWSWRVMAAGWGIVFDPALWVDLSHRWREGPLAYYRRWQREVIAVASFASLEPYPLRACLRDWWFSDPHDGRSAWRWRFRPNRLAELAGSYTARRGVHARRNRS